MRFRPARRRQSGYAILVIVSLLGLVALFAVVRSVAVTGSPAGSVAHDLAVLDQAKQALLGYAATYRDSHSSTVPIPGIGFLPCPASDGNGNSAGSCSLQGSAVAGFLPFRTLNLPDLRDSGGACLWYAVAGSIKNAPSLLQLNWDVQGQFTIRDGNGSVLAAAPNVEDGGPVAVIVAPGRPLGSQSRATASTTCGNVPTPAEFLEGGPVFPNAGNVSLLNGAAANPNGNDRIVWITGREVFERIAQRGDFAPMVNGLIDEMASCLSYGLPAPASPVSIGGHQFGLAPTTTTSGTPSICPDVPQPWPAPPRPTGVSVNADYIQLWRNWRETFRYMRCSGLTQCASVNGAACRGVLLFGGKKSATQTRTTAAEKALAGNYLDGTTAANWDAGVVAYDGPISFDPATPTNDVVRCLN